jgi:molecular chaperone DnaK
MSHSTENKSSPIVGIDFGTTKTMVAVYDPARNHARTQRLGRGRDELPTAIFTTASGKVLFGDEAEDEGESDQANLIRRFKMKLGHPGPAIVGRRKATAEELVADFLRYLKIRLESEVLHEKVQKAVLTVPAMFGPAQRKSLMNAAKTAGFMDVTLLDEPTAAGLAYCDHNLVGKDQRFLVVDWGGGTFDVALLERSADRGTKIIREFVAGLGDIGGEALDDDLWGHVSHSLVDAGYERLDRQDRNMWGRYRREISRSKERLSNIDSVKMNFLLNGGNPVRIDFQRSVLEDAISVNVVKGANFVVELLERCRAAGQMPDFVLLAGGTSRIPMIQRVFEERLQLECRKWSEGREAIALGAALHARDLWYSSVSPNGSHEKPARNEKLEAMSIYRGLLEAAWADGMISQEERVFLGKRRKELELTIEESQALQIQVLGSKIDEVCGSQQAPQKDANKKISEPITYVGGCTNLSSESPSAAQIELTIEGISGTEVTGILKVHNPLSGGSRFTGQIKDNIISFVTKEDELEINWKGHFLEDKITDGEYSVKIKDPRIRAGMGVIQEGIWNCSRLNGVSTVSPPFKMSLENSDIGTQILAVVPMDELQGEELIMKTHYPVTYFLRIENTSSLTIRNARISLTAENGHKYSVHVPEIKPGKKHALVLTPIDLDGWTLNISDVITADANGINPCTFEVTEAACKAIDNKKALSREIPCAVVLRPATFSKNFVLKVYNISNKKLNVLEIKSQSSLDGEVTTHKPTVEILQGSEVEIGWLEIGNNPKVGDKIFIKFNHYDPVNIMVFGGETGSSGGAWAVLGGLGALAAALAGG